MTLKDLSIFKDVVNRIKDTQTVKEMFDEAEVPAEVIHYVPMCFSPLEVSARTQHGIIYFNEKLRDNPKDIDHYAVHELTHVLQQCFSEGPTTGSTEDSYLDNPYEIEGFNNQTKFLSEEKGDEAAEKYIEKVLKHHDVDGKEKQEKKQELLEFASKKQLKFDFEKEEPVTLDMVNELFDRIENTPIEEFLEKNKHRFHKYYKLLPSQKETVKENVDNIISIIDKNLSKKAKAPQPSSNLLNIVFNLSKQIIDKRIYTNNITKIEKLKSYNLQDAKNTRNYVKKQISTLEDQFSISDLDTKILKINVDDLSLIISKNQDSTYDIFYDDKKFVNLSRKKLEDILYGKVDLITKLLVKLTDILNKLEFIISSHSNVENIIELHRLMQKIEYKQIIPIKSLEVIPLTYYGKKLYIKLFFNKSLYEAGIGPQSKAYFASFDGKDKDDVLYTISFNVFCDDINSVEKYDQFISEFKESARHELLHLEQDKFEKNYPFKKIKLEEKNIDLEQQEHDEKYELLDAEFYPILNEEIFRFKSYFGKISDPDILSILAKRWTRNPLSAEEVFKVKKYLINEDSLFFKKLKDKDFEKYKKAVREFVKAVVN